MLEAPVARQTSIIGGGVPRASSATGLNAVVLAHFRHGFYASVKENIFAIGGPSVPAGPVHISLGADPPKPPENSVLRILADRIETRNGDILLLNAREFAPDIPSPFEFNKIAANLIRFASVEYFPEDILPVCLSLKCGIKQVEFDKARQALEGRGGGLTPSGDDVLAGLLLCLSWSGADLEMVARIAESARTTDLSRTFLRWAAKGQSIAPVHDLVALLRDPDGSASHDINVQRAVEAITRIGASSGRALLAGLGLGAAGVLRAD